MVVPSLSDCNGPSQQSLIVCADPLCTGGAKKDTHVKNECWIVPYNSKPIVLRDSFTLKTSLVRSFEANLHGHPYRRTHRRIAPYAFQWWTDYFKLIHEPRKKFRSLRSFICFCSASVTNSSGLILTLSKSSQFTREVIHLLGHGSGFASGDEGSADNLWLNIVFEVAQKEGG